MAKRNQSFSKRGRDQKYGMPPGSAVYVGEERSFNPILNLITYAQDYHQEKLNVDPKLLNDLDPLSFHWISLIGIHNANLITLVCDHFKLHALTIEDILNAGARPKCEIFDDYIYSGLKMIKNEKPDVIIEKEQVSLVLLKNVVITFQEVEGDVFDPIRKRLSQTDSRARKKRSDYLFMLLHDIIVDNYLNIIDEIETCSDALEKDILLDQNQKVFNRIQDLKGDILYLQKVIIPVKESVGKLTREEGKLILNENLKYFSDLLDHVLQVTESLEAQREIVASHRELYMSMTNITMNNIMKVLTIVTSIFIPLTFIVGVYGMNFDNMPELKMKNGYFIVMVIMLVIALIMIYFFRKRKWL